MKVYKVLTKDWEDPDGFVHKGEWCEFIPVNITRKDLLRCQKTGFSHLLNGEWLWVKYLNKNKTPMFINIHTIQSIVDEGDTPIKIEWVNNDWVYIPDYDSIPRCELSLEGLN